MIQDPYITELISRHKNTAFLDEVGTGAIFGEIVACAVIIPHPFFLEEVDDSKKLKHEKIYELAPKLKEKVIYSFGIVTSEELRSIKNIFKANRLALKKAVKNLPQKPEALFIDGRFKIPTKVPIYNVVKGDSLVFGIAVASIIAKDFRDHYMIEKYGKRYAHYHIKKNKGYRSPDHLIAIREYGTTKHHRIWMPQIEKVVSGDYDKVIERKYLYKLNAIRKKAPTKELKIYG